MKTKVENTSCGIVAVILLLAIAFANVTMTCTDKACAEQKDSPRNEKRRRAILRKEIERWLEGTRDLVRENGSGWVIVFVTTISDVNTEDGTARTTKTTTYAAHSFINFDQAVQSTLDFVTQAKGSEERFWYGYSFFSYDRSELGLQFLQREVPAMEQEAKRAVKAVFERERGA